MNGFDGLFKNPLTLLNPVRGADGTLSWSRHPARGLRVVSDERNTTDTGVAKLELGTYYVVSEVPPVAGGRIEEDGASYEITKVRRFHDLDGKLIAYRCTLD